MKCPVCKEPDLLMTHREQIEIDYCPQCRGVWLDRGELDRLIEKAQADAPAAPAQAPIAPAPTQQYQNKDTYYQQDNKHYRKHDDDYYKHQKHYKRKSLLSEIFDF